MQATTSSWEQHEQCKPSGDGSTHLVVGGVLAHAAQARLAAEAREGAVHTRALTGTTSASALLVLLAQLAASRGWAGGWPRRWRAAGSGCRPQALHGSKGQRVPVSAGQFKGAEAIRPYILPVCDRYTLAAVAHTRTAQAKLQVEPRHRWRRCQNPTGCPSSRTCQYQVSCFWQVVPLIQRLSGRGASAQVPRMAQTPP